VGHTVGDLQSVTNAAGHVMQYTLYDKSGRLLQSIDANGATTDNQYSPRGWLTQASVTPAGGGTPLVHRLRLRRSGATHQRNVPGQGAITYTYDAAHRLTGITDAAGNSVTYTLDNAGNRTAEQFKDPSGTLAKTITRAFDALNRSQTVTGECNEINSCGTFDSPSSVFRRVAIHGSSRARDINFGPCRRCCFHSVPQPNWGSNCFCVHHRHLFLLQWAHATPGVPQLVGVWGQRQRSVGYR